MRRRLPPVLRPDDPPTTLPPADQALDRPPGLLAIGGALTPDWLRHAYRHGCFPWYSLDEPIQWWSPNPRMVFRPEAIRVTKSLRQSIKNRGYLIGFDNEFSSVVQACATRGAAIQATDDLENSPTDNTYLSPDNTWIVPDMIQAYQALHAAGDAHCVEVWREHELVGGLYGVSLGGMFWGESMFSRARDASKVALVALAAECQRRSIALIDAQFHTPHLASLGAFEMPRQEFLQQVARYAGRLTGAEPWRSPPVPAVDSLSRGERPS